MKYLIALMLVTQIALCVLGERLWSKQHSSDSSEGFTPYDFSLQDKLGNSICQKQEGKPLEVSPGHTLDECYKEAWDDSIKRPKEYAPQKKECIGGVPGYYEECPKMGYLEHN